MSRVILEDAFVAALVSVGVGIVATIIGLVAGGFSTPGGTMFFSGGLYLLDDPQFQPHVVRAFLWISSCGFFSSYICLWFVRSK